MSNSTSTLPALQPRPVAVIVGASSGIGAALAERLAQEGYRVALLARREDRLQQLARLLNEAHGSETAYVYPHDVTHFDQVPELFQRILKEMHRIDAVIYAAGIMLPMHVEEYDFEKDRKMIEVNLLGAMAWLGTAARYFQGLGTGQIVGISSVAGDRGRVGNPAYYVSKAGLTTYLESLRNRLSRRGVHVLTVKPGFVETPMLATARQQGRKVFWVISPAQAAEDIVRAMKKRKQVIYTPARWRWVMFIIRNIPSFIFRRLGL